MRHLLVGHVTLDRYGPARLPGGAVYYAGHVARALGAPGSEGSEVRVLTAAGPDFPATALAGLAAHVLPAQRTTTFTNVTLRSGRAQRAEAPATPLDPAALPPGWRDAELLHLAPVLGEVDLRAWRAAVRAPFVGLQIQGYVRRLAPDGAVESARWEPEAADLTGVSAAVLGDDDVLGDPDLPRRLADAVPAVAFTHGASGCELLLRGRRVLVGTFRTFETDPTGAGDAFAAAFFLALARGDDPVDAARLGAAAASIVVEGRAGEALQRVSAAPARAPHVLARYDDSP